MPGSPGTPGDVAAAPTGGADGFRTANGLLYPPELWGALQVSPLAGLLRMQALDALGHTPPWPHSPSDTFDSLLAETSPLEAAHVVHEAGLVGPGVQLPWSDEDVRQWWTAATTDGHAELMWMAAELADAAGVSLDRTAASLDVLTRAAEGPDLLPAVLAAGLLTDHAPSTSEEGLPATNVRTGRDAAHLLLIAATEDGLSPEDTDPLLLQLATEAAPQDDWAYSYLARAYAAAGMPDRARSVVESFDELRILPGEELLEPPLFEGTVGSTFRMVSYFHAGGTLEANLGEQARDELATAVGQHLGTDAMHQVAGTATMALLDPDAVPRAARQEAVDALSAELGTAPLTVDRAFVWTYLAEYAHAMDVPVRFPGLSEDAAHEWVTQLDDGAAWPIGRFLLAVHDTDNLGRDAATATLGTELGEHLAAADVATTPSTELFTGVLAVHALTGRWVHEPEDLAAEVAQRWGACRGGFENFVRESRQAGQVCNVDSSAHALRGDQLWDGNAR